MTHEITKKQKSVIVGLYSSIILALLALPSVYIHEVGHLLVCASEGINHTMDINVFGGTLYCHMMPANESLFLAFGGIFAMMILSVPLIWKKVSKNVVLFIPLVSLIIGHGVNSIIETFLATWYLQHIVGTIILLNAIVVISFFVLFYFMVIKKDGIEKRA